MDDVITGDTTGAWTSGYDLAGGGDTAVNGAPADNNAGTYGDVLNVVQSATDATSKLYGAVLGFQTQRDQLAVARMQASAQAEVDKLRAQKAVLDAQEALNPTFLGLSYNSWMLLLAGTGVYYAAKAVRK